MRKIVREKYSDASVCCKNGYYYVVSSQFSGHTLGSGSSANNAWEDAYEFVTEEN